MKKTIEWQTKSGGAARVEVELRTTERINLDGDIFERSCCEMHISGYYNDNLMGLSLVRQSMTVQGVEIAGYIGKLCIPSTQMIEIDAAIAAIHATPEWKAKIARQRAAERVEREYQAHRSMMRKAMGY